MLNPWCAIVGASSELIAPRAVGFSECPWPPALIRWVLHLEMWFVTCCLLSLLVCCSKGGIDGIEFVLGTVLDHLLFPGN